MSGLSISVAPTQIGFSQRANGKITVTLNPISKSLVRVFQFSEVATMHGVGNRGASDLFSSDFSGGFNATLNRQTDFPSLTRFVASIMSDREWVSIHVSVT